MKEINIKRKDRNIDVIKEKMLEILDEYEEAKEENNEDAMIKLEGYFNKQKALMEDSKEYFGSYDTDDIKMQANYDTDKAIEDAYSIGRDGNIFKNNLEILKSKIKKRKFVFRKFKKQLIIFGLVAALGASTLGLVSHFKKKNHQKNIVPIETTTEYKDDINDDSIKEENDIIIPETDVNNFSNDNVSVDESSLFKFISS